MTKRRKKDEVQNHVLRLRRKPNGMYVITEQSHFGGGRDSFGHCPGEDVFEASNGIAIMPGYVPAYKSDTLYASNRPLGNGTSPEFSIPHAAIKRVRAALREYNTASKLLPLRIDGNEVTVTRHQAYVGCVKVPRAQVEAVLREMNKL